MDPFYERLIARAATIDELLSSDFTALPGEKGDADLAAKRLAAWCRACASGDWSLLSRRLKRDGLSIDQVLARFATVRRSNGAAPPAWIEDAIWIETALQDAGKTPPAMDGPVEPHAFEQLFTPAVEQAEARLWASAGLRASDHLSATARACLRHLLLEDLCGLCAPALYERFAKDRKARSAQGHEALPGQQGATAYYDRFIAEMKTGGLRRLFEEKPVLLRLIATVTRQWLETSREFVTRLDVDLATIRRDLLQSKADCLVARIEGGLSDPHHGGRSVLTVEWENGARVVYKPKDLRLDSQWHALVGRLNRAGAPIELRAMRAIARDGYGWTEYVAHAGCTDAQGHNRFFRRAGAWLALFHCFAGTDVHQENMIAAGEHPVPIDLETMLQATGAPHATAEAEAQASEAATEIVANSVMAVGLLPAYGRTVDDDIFVVGGVASDWTSGKAFGWSDINSDRMRPATTKTAGTATPNLPHLDGRYAKLGDHIDDFIAGFEEYATFLMLQSRSPDQGGLFDGFAGLPVRKVVRPTQFYYLLLERLKNHRMMHDGVIWSAQADFLARLADWDKDSDSAWPLQRAERLALVDLNVPHFVLPSDGSDIRDITGSSARAEMTSGLQCARTRVHNLDQRDIAWQVEVIRQNTGSVSRSANSPSHGTEPKVVSSSEAPIAPIEETFLAEADRVAGEISRHAIRRGPGAAWIGLAWLRDSEVSQLTVLGPDLYNGACGIALFLAAHAMTRGRASSADLALAALSRLRKNLRDRNAARLARSLGIGGATGLGSIVYALSVMSRLLCDDRLADDARRAAELMSDDLIAADRQLDVIGGSAGAILGLLRLHRDTRSVDVLKRALKCGEHLLAQPRVGPAGRRSWRGQGPHPHALNGMSHGAAGFALALASLAAVTGRQEFAEAASECTAFENASYAAEHANWPDLRDAEPTWRSQWCHGAVGIGLARIAMTRQGPDPDLTSADIHNALAGATRDWHGHVDTLCCGALGNVEFISEAGKTLGRGDLRELASRRLSAVVGRAASSGYRWNSSETRFNLGLFRGLAGVGYSCLRQVAGPLPNVLIWE
jgi:type 2 lantibiotic biosynthesis protein LanM